jgi:hypothetical protein
VADERREARGRVVLFLADAERLFELELFFSDAMRFVPVDLGFANRTIAKFNGRSPFHLPPLPSTVESRQSAAITESRSRSDDVNRGDFADDAELHAFRLTERCSCRANVSHVQLRGQFRVPRPVNILVSKNEARKRRAEAGPRKLLRPKMTFTLSP